MLQLHVLLHQRVVRVESGVGSVHVVDDGAHATHDGGETHDGQQEVTDHEEELLLPLRQRDVADGGQDQRGEVKAVEVLAPQALKAGLRGVWVHPGVTPEAQVLGQGKVEAAVPVDDHENVEHQLGDAKGIGVSRAGLGAVKGFKEAGHTQKAVQPQRGCVRAQPHVSNVCGHQGSQVQTKAPGANIATRDPTFVHYKDALFQESCWEEEREGMVSGVGWGQV